ncbi:MAG: hypothetical protein FJX77_13510, partial [Armatimonadetes bacterium]|nr:hypothetical protein [Armatimonadota bacterium]
MLIQKVLGRPARIMLVAALIGVWAGHAAETAQIEPAAGRPQIAIGNPLPTAVVAGRISLSVAYNVGQNRISAFTLMVDDKIHFSRMLANGEPRGIQYLELDTRTIPDGNHTIKVLAMGPRGILATDAVDLVIRNGVGGLDLVPPLVQFRNLVDGQEVSGKLNLELIAEDNVTMDLLVSIFVNQRSAFIKNRPPYGLEVDTAPFLDPQTGVGTLRIEAWAYDASNNLGKSRILTLKVRPAGASENQTRARLEGAPGAAARTAIVMPDYGPAGGPQPIRTSTNQVLSIPLLGTRTVPLPVPEMTAPAPVPPGDRIARGSV